MMSKKQWTVLLGLFLLYLLVGASIFYIIESKEELIKRIMEKREKMEIQELLHKHFKPADNESETVILQRLSDYCGRPMSFSDDDDDEPLKWNFYHSFFFVLTVVSTIGYGNLSPTTFLSRILMIVYALIGIPINGILLATLGDFFGKKFIKIYNKYKSIKSRYELWKFGLCGQVVISLVPGFLFFIFIPALIISKMEEWTYEESVYFAFVTLTTIGFGDYVAGAKSKYHGFDGIYQLAYEIFLIIWIVFGLGYLVMLLGFISRGMRSKQMVRLEHKLATNIKQTQSKIWHGFVRDMNYFRKVLNEIYMLRFKPVYRDFQYTPTLRTRSMSCPDLTIYREPTLSQRRRAFSTSYYDAEDIMGRVQSDTDLERIDRQATFENQGLVQPSELLARVVDVLGRHQTSDDYLSDHILTQGINCFSDSQILASEQVPGSYSGWSVGDDKLPKVQRGRTYSQYTLPDNFTCENVDWTWSGPMETEEIKEIRKNTKKMTGSDLDRLTTPRKVNNLPLNLPRHGKKLLLKLRHPFARNNKPKSKSTTDVLSGEQPYKDPPFLTSTVSDWLPKRYDHYMTHTGVPGNQFGNVYSESSNAFLEETTIGDLIRAIKSIESQVEPSAGQMPKRKLGTASLTPPKLPSLLTLFPPNVQASSSRRGSIMPSGSRKMSLRPAANIPPQNRRFSVRPVYQDPYGSGRLTAENQFSKLNVPSIRIEMPDDEVNRLAPIDYGSGPRRNTISTSTSANVTGPALRKFSFYPVAPSTAHQSMRRPKPQSDVLRRQATEGSRQDALTEVRLNVGDSGVESNANN